MELMTTLQELYDSGLEKKDSEEQIRSQRKQAAMDRRRTEWTRVCLLTRPASPEEYVVWLQGHIDQGGEPTTFESGCMTTNFYIATGDIKLPAWDEEPINLIIPAGFEIQHQRLGLNCLFYMEGFTHKGFTIPMYRDTI